MASAVYDMPNRPTATVDPGSAWSDIATARPEAVTEGNAGLLFREQNQIIAGQYDDMRQHLPPPTLIANGALPLAARAGSAPVQLDHLPLAGGDLPGHRRGARREESVADRGRAAGWGAHHRSPGCGGRRGRVHPARWPPGRGRPEPTPGGEQRTAHVRPLARPGLGAEHRPADNRRPLRTARSRTTTPTRDRRRRPG